MTALNFKKVMKLQAAIKYAEDDMKACMVILQEKMILASPFENWVLKNQSILMDFFLSKIVQMQLNIKLNRLLVSEKIENWSV